LSVLVRALVALVWIVGSSTTTVAPVADVYDATVVIHDDQVRVDASSSGPSPPATSPERCLLQSPTTIGTTTTTGISTCAFVATEAGSRGLSNLGGIIEETGVNSAGGRIFTSTGDIAQKDFAGIVNGGLTRGDQVSILTGAHGAADGSLIADASMYADDLRAFGDLPGVHVYNVASMTPAEIGGVLNGPGTIIGGFCNSGACLAPYGG
jgi:hypothetical protein